MTYRMASLGPVCRRMPTVEELLAAGWHVASEPTPWHTVWCAIDDDAPDPARAGDIEALP